MKDDSTITSLHHPGMILDPLTEIARDGARQMLAVALKAEAASFIAQFSEELLPEGRQRIVRHGAGPERIIQKDRAGPCAAAEGARSCDGDGARGEDPVHLEHPAEMGAALEEPRCSAAGPLSARRLDR